MDGLLIFLGLLVFGVFVQNGLTNIAIGLKAIAMAKNPNLFTDKEFEEMKTDISTSDSKK